MGRPFTKRPTNIRFTTLARRATTPNRTKAQPDMLVICNGMGRGGSTPQYNLVRALLTVTESGESHGYMVDREGHTQFMPSEQLW
jgi:hypothetical protein